MTEQNVLVPDPMIRTELYAHPVLTVLYTPLGYQQKGLIEVTFRYCVTIQTSLPPLNLTLSFPEKAQI